LKLDGVVAVGGLHQNVRSGGLGGGGEEIAVNLPALLLERVHREADERALSRCGDARAATSDDEAGDNAESAGNKDEQDADVHACCVANAALNDERKMRVGRVMSDGLSVMRLTHNQ
jgi:hypothetical protein